MRLNLDAAASANALPAVARRVEEFLPWYSSVHRGAGDKLRLATDAYQAARAAASGLRGAAAGRRHRRPEPPKLPTVAWINEPIEEAAQIS